MSAELTPRQAADLEVARGLVRAGVPVILGRPDDRHPTGFALPPGWQHATPDESVVDAWRPGWALCAVTGHALDLIDLDPRSGGDPTALGPIPVLGRATTPSGGTHLFVAPLGVESRDGAWPGIDVKSGTDEGGRGFAFIAPTVRRSKVDGAARPYRWQAEPNQTRVRDAAHVARTQGVSGGLAEVRQRVLDLRAARRDDTEPRRLPRSVAAREWQTATDRLVADLRDWAARGWGGAAHAGLLAATRHLVLLSPEHAADGYLACFTRAGVTPDEADLAKLDSALDKYAHRADVVVPDEELDGDEGFWLGAQQEPPPFAPEPSAAAPPGTFDLVTPDRVRNRRPPPAPAYGAFGGGRALFYDEGVHWVQGESESGKSWVALSVVLDVLRAGGLVLLVDHEDSEGPVLERLEQLGATDAEFGRLCYVAALDVPHAAIVEHLTSSGRDYACVVVDGVTSALTAAGLSGRDEQELTAWCDALPRRARMAVCVDHVVKAVDERRGMAVGTQAKKSVVTGASYEVECIEKFGRGTTGELVLRPQKDKRGGVRALIGARGVRVRFSSDPATGAVSMLVPSSATTPERVRAVEHGRAERVLALTARLEAAGIEPSTKRGANGRAWETLKELSGTAGDDALKPDAWRTFLARSGVPEATYPTYVRDFLARSGAPPQDHQEDHQGKQGNTVNWGPTPPLTSEQGKQGDHQGILDDHDQGDHQGNKANGQARVVTW